MFLFKKKEKNVPPIAPSEPEPAAKHELYEFIVKSENEKTDKAISKYQKFWTDPEDKYNGMKLLEFKEEGYPGDKVYEYPPLEVEVRLEPLAGKDGATEIKAYILDDSDEGIYVGKSAKTKAKKILRILQDNDPKISGELYGGKYWKIEDSGYVNNDWVEALTVRVYLEW